MSKTSATYEAAGVSIDAGNALVEAIKPLAKATTRLGCLSTLGGFGAVFDLKGAGFGEDAVLVSTTDGVGTKLKLAIETGRHEGIGIDLVAMCVNDLVVQGAEPLFFLDYFATGALDVKVATTIIASIAEGCKQAGCALVGGETAEMPGMYAAEDYDLAGFAVGAVARSAILPKLDAIQSGDVVLGLASNGVHSNGYSLVRHIQKSDPSAFKTWEDTLLQPTRIYVKSCLKAIRTHLGVKALAHITGGGLIENLPRVLPQNLGAVIHKNRWDMPDVFQWLQEAGNIAEAEMFRTFNCGIGMAMVVERTKADAIIQLLRLEGESVYTIGEITEHTSTHRVEVV